MNEPNYSYLKTISNDNTSDFYMESVLFLPGLTKQLSLCRFPFA
jgi:hypothetical protein